MSTQNYTAGGAVTKSLFVKFSSGDIVKAAAAGDNVVGVNERIDIADTERIDVIHSGPAELVIGAAVTAGDRLISDANGKGIPTAAGTDVIGAIALEDGTADGDIIRVLVALSAR